MGTPANSALTTADRAKVAGLADPAQALLAENLSPSRYLAVLEEKGMYQDAIKFMATSMPAPLAIEWAHTCVKQFQGPDPKGKRCMKAADAWMKDRSEQSREAAKQAVSDEGAASPAGCVAMAIIVSSKTVVGGDHPQEIPPPPWVSQKLVAGAILASAIEQNPQEAPVKHKKALEIGRGLVRTSAARARNGEQA